MTNKSLLSKSMQSNHNVYNKVPVKVEALCTINLGTLSGCNTRQRSCWSRRWPGDWCDGTLSCRTLGGRRSYNTPYKARSTGCLRAKLVEMAADGAIHHRTSSGQSTGQGS